MSEEVAFKRKEELKLKGLKRKSGSNSAPKNIGEEHGALPKPKFRSYKPSDEVFQPNALPDAPSGDVETEVKEQLDSAKSKIVIDELDISSLAPRKPDWDLKRDVVKKMQKLERRTQKAIAELIREKLNERQDVVLSSSDIS